MARRRLPIRFSPIRLARSLKDVPLWGLAVAIAAAIGVLLLIKFGALALYVVVGVMLAFYVVVRLADARYRRSDR